MRKRIFVNREKGSQNKHKKTAKNDGFQIFISVYNYFLSSSKNSS